MAIGGISFLLLLNACDSHPVIRTDTERKGYAARGETVDPSQIFASEILSGFESPKAPELPPRQKSDEFPLPAPKREEPKITHTPALVIPQVLIAATSPESASWRTVISQAKPKAPVKKSAAVARTSKEAHPGEIMITTFPPTIIDKTTIVPQSRDPITSWLLALLAIGIFGITIVLSLILREMQRQNNPVNNPRRPPPRA